MTSLHGGYVYSVISFHFIFYLDKMSAVVNTQVLLQDVRQTNIEDVKRAIAFGLRLDQDETNLMCQIFNINLSKIMTMNKPEFDSLREIELQYLQCQLILRIAKKIKLMMSSLEDFISHDLMVEANFQYDQPQQMVFDEIQQYLNLMATSDSIQTITNP